MIPINEFCLQLNNLIIFQTVQYHLNKLFFYAKAHHFYKILKFEISFVASDKYTLK